MMEWLKRLTFNLWYLFRKPPWDTGITPPELITFMAQHLPGKALDLGCGTGTNAITLASHGWEVTAVDFALKAIQSARQKARQSGVEVDFQVGDVTRLPNINPPFDLVLDIGCFHTLAHQAKVNYVHNLERWLASDGNFLMYAFFRSPDSSGPGLVETDLELLAKYLVLVNRQDGTERGRRPSAWFTYRLDNST